MTSAEPTIFILLIISSVHSANRHESRFRGLETMDDINEFPYVVALCFNEEVRVVPGSGVTVHRAGTATLVSDHWAITGAHVLDPRVSRVRYGDMTVPYNATTATYSKILREIRHPASRSDGMRGLRTKNLQSGNDIALLMVERVDLTKYGRLSAVDYMTMLGYPVRYAGYGSTFRTDISIRERIQLLRKDECNRLQVGEGIVVRCQKHVVNDGPYICIAPKCTGQGQVTRRGFLGGPLLHAGQVVGVLMGGYDMYDNVYTPLSPYLDWIQRVVATRVLRHTTIF